MRKVHMMLQGKGGVGKSTCIALLAQYLKDHLGRPALCLDTDATNPTFTAWQSLGVKHINIAVDGDLEKARFDLVVSEVVDSKIDVVIDNGAQGFMPITSYMAVNDLEAGFEELDRLIVLHTVVVGGEAHRHTMEGLLFVAEGFKSSPVVAWLNPMNGPIDRAAFDKEIAEAGLSDRLVVIDLPNFGGPQASTFGRDFDVFLKQKLTFKEAQAERKAEWILARRFRMMQDRFYALFDEVLLANELV